MSYQPENGLAEEQMTEEVEQYIESVQERLAEAKEELSRAVLGQPELLELIMITLLSGGHALLEGVPGTAKTVLAETIGQVFGLDDKRIQCTPDLMPSDILGGEIMEENKQTGERSFRFLKGPIFTRLVLGDEINRASPRTQSAFLQAMQEKKVTVGDETYRLPAPFHVLATQNPLEQEGTNPLPEAQLDRFLLKAVIDYPDRDAERAVLMGTTRTHHTWKEIMNESADLEAPGTTLVSPKELKQVFNAQSLIHLQHLVRKLPIGEKPLEAILDIVRNARPHFWPTEKRAAETEDLNELFDYVNQNVAYGPGTRALQAFALATRARALIHGRLSPNVDDVKAMAEPILAHRLAPSIAAGASRPPIKEKQIIEQIVARLG